MSSSSSAHHRSQSLSNAEEGRGNLPGAPYGGDGDVQVEILQKLLWKQAALLAALNEKMNKNAGAIQALEGNLETKMQEQVGGLEGRLDARVAGLENAIAELQKQESESKEQGQANSNEGSIITHPLLMSRSTSNTQDTKTRPTTALQVDQFTNIMAQRLAAATQPATATETKLNAIEKSRADIVQEWISVFYSLVGAASLLILFLGTVVGIWKRSRKA
ncbi:hypothetical protein HK104_010533 [Borealophlyctis nickersoniae]|nr:hypothetical protein HK104_010533 [Borealophlyctis nickersoniae]